MLKNDILQKNIALKSVLFVVGFWTIVSIYMAGIYRLINTIDLTAIISRLLGN